MRTRIVALICVLFCITAQAVIADGLVPITTSSSEARAAYLRARDLFENLRNIEARADLQAALAWIAVAQASTSAQEFFENVERAAELTDKVSPGERLWIEGFEAGVKGLTDVQHRAGLDSRGRPAGLQPVGHSLLRPAELAGGDRSLRAGNASGALVFTPIQHARLLASFRR